MTLRKRKPKLVVICGPTATGKTAFAIELAELLNGEIVGADSMQVYRQMDIGTAKPAKEELARVPHHLIDVVDPNDPFDAEKYASLARDAVADILARRRLPLVAGGTGLYIKTLLFGLFRTQPVDMEIRRRLQRVADYRGAVYLHERLMRVDPAAAGRIHPNDVVRVVRALEVFELTGRPLSACHRDHGFAESPYEVFTIGLGMPRKRLYERIDRRVDAMVAAGFPEEVRGLMERGFSLRLKSMQSIGYRHIGAFLSGELPWQEALKTMKRDTRRYAKRQMTWFRRQAGVHWTDPGKAPNMLPNLIPFLGAASP